MSSSSLHREPAAAIITMGGQAQVVTFALDLLLAAGEIISSVLVLHFSPDNPRVKLALRQLSAEFSGNHYNGHPLLYRHLPVALNGVPLAYVCSEYDAEAVWQVARDLLGDLKQQGLRLHICIAGGPRMLALTLTSAALLQCDHLDRLWHLYTPTDFIEQARDGTILHAPPEAGIRLLPVPIAPLGSYFPALRQLVRPGQAASALLAPEDAARCHQVWSRLTIRQKDVLEALASGQLPQEAADALHITLKTLDAHKTQILAECRVAWALPEDEHLTYHFLHTTFGPWISLRQSEV
jgi:CRISPR-associated protein Csx14